MEENKRKITFQKRYSHLALFQLAEKIQDAFHVISMLLDSFKKMF